MMHVEKTPIDCGQPHLGPLFGASAAWRHGHDVKKLKHPCFRNETQMFQAFNMGPGTSFKEADARITAGRLSRWGTTGNVGLTGSKNNYSRKARKVQYMRPGVTGAQGT